MRHLWLLLAIPLGILGVYILLSGGWILYGLAALGLSYTLIRDWNYGE